MEKSEVVLEEIRDGFFKLQWCFVGGSVSGEYLLSGICPLELRDEDFLQHPSYLAGA